MCHLLCQKDRRLAVAAGFRLVDVGANAANGEPDEERDKRHSSGLDQIDIPSPGRQRQRFCQLADTADTIIGHRRDRQPFHRLLQAQLLAGTGVHRLQ